MALKTLMPEGVDQCETQPLRIVVPSVHHPTQFARGVDAVEYTLVVDVTHLDDVVHGVFQIRRQDVNHHCLDAHHGPSRHNSQGQFDVLLQLRVFLVQRREIESLAVQQASLKLERPREHRGEIQTWFRVAT